MPDEEKSSEATNAENKPIIPGAKQKAENTGIENLPITMIGVRTEGTGSPIVDGQEIVTPDHQPNLTVRVISPALAIAARAGNAFFTTLGGGLGLTGTASITGAQALQWASWKVALAVAISAALVNVLQSLATVFNGLEKRFPLLTGNI